MLRYFVNFEEILFQVMKAVSHSENASQNTGMVCMQIDGGITGTFDFLCAFACVSQLFCNSNS